jgi:hypothetical protein
VEEVGGWGGGLTRETDKRLRPCGDEPPIDYLRIASSMAAAGLRPRLIFAIYRHSGVMRDVEAPD